MHGKGCLSDNVVVEWLWKGLKYQELYQSHLRDGQRRSIRSGLLLDVLQPDQTTPHQALDGRMLDEVCVDYLPI